MRHALVVSLVLLASGCALVAGLKDRDAPDDAGATTDATVDGTTDGASLVDGSDGGANDGPANDARVGDGAPGDGARDAADGGGDAADAGCAQGAGVVVCGADASVACGVGTGGCCIEAGTCGVLSDCFGHHLTCDGPEDCDAGLGCCPFSSSSLVGTVCANCGAGAATLCHSACDCAADVPICCPFPDAPSYGRCRAACP